MPATPLTVGDRPDGGFPEVLVSGLTNDLVVPPAGASRRWSSATPGDVPEVSTSAGWVMADRTGHPVTGAELQDPGGGVLAMDGPAHRQIRQATGHLFIMGVSVVAAGCVGSRRPGHPRRP